MPSFIFTVDVNMSSEPSLTISPTGSPTTVNSLLDILTSRVGTTETEVDTLQTDVNGLESRVTVAEQDIVDLDTRLDTAEAEIDALQAGGVGGGDLTALTTRVTSAEADIDALQSDVGGLTTTTTALDSRLDTAEPEIDQLQTDVTSLDGRLDTAEGTLTSLDTRLDSAEATITSHTSSLSTLDGRVDGHDTDITALQAADSALDTRLDTAEASITTQGASITSIAARVTDLEAWKRRVLDFAQYGTPNDPLTDNTPALEQALSDAHDLGGAVIDFSAFKEWHFLTAIDANPVSDEDKRHYDHIHFRGLSPEITAQHQESGSVGNAEDTYFTRLVFHQAAGATWWTQERTYEFGPFSIENLTLQCQERMNIMKLGDEGGLLSSAFRGLYMTNCYLTCIDHVGSDWITSDATGGYVLPTTRNYGIHTVRGYDVVMNNVYGRGWVGAMFKFVHNDRTELHNCRTLICQLAESVDLDGASNAHVPTIFNDCWAESPTYYGCVAEGGMFSNWRAELGYNAVFEPDVQPYALPATMTWSITAEDDFIQFASLPSGFTLDRYFFPYSVIRLSPTTATETTVPPRHLYITAVDTALNQVTFKNADGSSYVGRNISGDGTTCERMFGTPLVFYGDRSYLKGFDCNFNQDATIPAYFFIPQNNTVEVSGNAGAFGSGEDADPDQFNPVIVASSAGTQYAHGNLCVVSKLKAPDHPLCFRHGMKYHPSLTYPDYDEATDSYIFLPGKGVSTTGNQDKKLTFHTQDGYWCYRLGDSGSGWNMIGLIEEALDTQVTVWCYATTTGRSLGVYGGANQQLIPLAQGWNRVSCTIPAADMIAGALGAFVQLGQTGNHILVRKAVVQQTYAHVVTALV